MFSQLSSRVRLSLFPLSFPLLFSSFSFSFSRLSASHVKFFTSSTNALSPVEREVFKFLKTIPVQSVNAASSSDLVYSGIISNVSARDGIISISIIPDRFYRDYKRVINEQLATHLKAWKPEVNWQIRISMNIPDRKSNPTNNKIIGLQGIKHIICVSSCKGGVGKSTVAVNLAYSLAQRDLRVGLFDADIYGPSLPTLVKVDQEQAQAELSEQQGQLIAPLTAYGVKLMSYGFLASSNPKAAAIMRGAMVSNLIRDLLSRTNWGILDYLVIDMPPGTGDIAITLIQSINFRGSVIVTTPQRLSYVDVVKGIELFQKTAVPILALVENMSFFQCDKCEEKHQIFGPSHLPLILANYTNIQQSQAFQFPILPQICSSGDSGDPFVLHQDTQKNHQMARAVYDELAAAVESQCEASFIESSKTPKIQFDQALQLLKIEVPTNSPLFLHPRSLRLSCRCAACVDEFTGEKKLNPVSIPLSIRPTGSQPRGNYAIAMAWSDGHASSLYPFSQILKLAKANPDQARAETSPPEEATNVQQTK
jgi:Mrp family chromosome partitioning ATPase/DUF971 family protein